MTGYEIRRPRGADTEMPWYRWPYGPVFGPPGVGRPGPPRVPVKDPEAGPVGPGGRPLIPLEPGVGPEYPGPYPDPEFDAPDLGWPESEGHQPPFHQTALWPFWLLAAVTLIILLFFFLIPISP